MTPPLPPGQREAAAFHRFGLTRFAERFPADPAARVLEVAGNVHRSVMLEVWVARCRSVIFSFGYGPECHEAVENRAEVEMLEAVVPTRKDPLQG